MNKKELICGLVLAALVAVLVFVGWLPLANAIGLLGVACLAWFFRKEELNHWIKVGLFLVLVPLAFWVASYEPEGFAYPQLFNLAGEAGETARYELSVDLAKGIAGFLLLYLLWPKLRVNEFTAGKWSSISVLLLAPLLIIGVAILLLGLRWQPKPIEQILQFAVVSLFITCVAEEVFMRFLFQQNLRNAIASFTANRALQEIIPLLLVTGVFVAIHTGISGAAVWVYALAGFLYGLSYTLSKNI
ncbi:CPBP family glutamic-type intramembrane protease, partial [Cellvibrio sp.]